MKIRKIILAYNVPYRHFAWASCSPVKLLQAASRPLCSLHKLLFSVFLFSGLFFPALAAAVTPMVAAGGSHTVSLQADGTVLAWGYNAYGQLGDGTTTNRLSPVAVPGLTGAVAVAASAAHTVALKADGTVWTWGNNDYGQLGDGTTTNRLSPVVVPGLTGVVLLAAGYRCAG